MPIKLRLPGIFYWVELRNEQELLKMEIQRLHVGSRLSEAAIHNQTVYLAGQIAEDVTQDIVGQTREVLGHVERLLAEAGSDKSRILMCQIYLADLKHYDGMNAAWDAWVVPGHAPPRATVQASLANPQWLIEVVVTAAL
jgi:enamine deaminase RidA (YjgF/YER057c/UK114 family)